eukprot:SAG31_NODE_42869_length_269_cov_1.223529_1_plen_44_part_10
MKPYTAVVRVLSILDRNLVPLWLLNLNLVPRSVLNLVLDNFKNE